MGLWRGSSHSDAQASTSYSSTTTRRRRRQGQAGIGLRPYPLATCHFCLEQSYIMPPLSSADEPDGNGSSASPIYDIRISHGHVDAWQCSACDCKNRRDERESGGMSSWEPAMTDPRMNGLSYARRGTPPASALLTQETATQPVFCHTCLTNQSLLMNLMANYLPDEGDPTYEATMAKLAEYRASLLQRYPPVCAECSPEVDKQLDKAHRLAKQEAMRHFLARGQLARSIRSSAKGKERARHPQVNDDVRSWVIHIWRLRGFAFVVTNIAFLWLPLRLLSVYNEPQGLESTLDLASRPSTMLTAACSIMWTAWNPRWYRLVLLRRRGFDIRLQGQQTWAQAQVVLWLLRLAFLLLCWAQRVDLPHLPKVTSITFAQLCAAFTLVQITTHIATSRRFKLVHGQPIGWKPRQSLSGASSANAAQGLDGAAFEAALSLQSQPVSIQKSTASSSSAALEDTGSSFNHLFQRNPDDGPVDDDQDDEDEDDLNGGALSAARRRADAMDWTPTAAPTELNPPSQTSTTHSSLGFAPWASPARGPSSVPNPSSAPQEPPALGPQRFFVPEQPTGLEDLLLDALKVRDEEERERRAARSDASASRWAGWWRR